MPAARSRLTIIFEGWQHLSHSYAMCLQQIELACLKCPAVQIFHRHSPYPSGKWQADYSLFSSEQRQQLASIPTPPDDLTADAVIRMGWPSCFTKDPKALRTFVWGTTEFQRVMFTHESMYQGLPVRDVLQSTACHVITTSQWSARGYLASGLPANQLTVIPAGIDPQVSRPVDEEQRQRLRRDLGWTDKFVLLNVGAMTENKGIKYLLEAMLRLVDRFPNLVLMLKGSDKLYPSRKLLSSCGSQLTESELSKIEPRIRYLGSNLSNEHLMTFFQAADLYVAPYIAEGFNLPVLEAGACGLSTLCTSGGSTDDFVDESWCRKIQSQLIESSDMVYLQPDINHLTDLLEAAIHDEAWRKLARQTAPAAIHSRYAWSTIAGRLCQAISKNGS